LLFGVTIFATDYTIQPPDLARRAEERGFESLWLTEHTHIPVNRRTPWPGGPEMPKEYSHTYDPFVALTAAAAATETLKIGTGVCLVVERDPIVTAKAVASLDRLSGGRFLFGIGGGWNAEEMENHGTNFKRRFAILRERMLAMKALWTQEEAEFHGRYVDFDPVWSFPKPLQKPHPPILMGGDGATTFDRVIEFGDGWFPISRRGLVPPNLREKVADLKRRAEAAGRDPAAISVSVFSAPGDAAFIAKCEAAGADRVIFQLPAAERDQVVARLNELAQFLK
jgi:probable F420-dependent oxidoreductase